MESMKPTHPTPLTQPVSAYRSYLIALSVWIVATLPAWRDLIIDWWVDPNYSHGLLIVPVAIFFIWNSRDRWQDIEPTFSGLGLFFFSGAAVLYLLGTAAAENFTVRVAMLGGIGALTWSMLGWTFIRRTWFAYVFLLFAIPWPYIIYYQVTFPMQLFSTKMACGFLDILGITFARQGNIIHLPGFSLEVVEACSGVRSLLSLTTLGAAYANLTQPGIVRPWVLFALSVPIAIGANIVRLVITAIGAYVWDPRIAQDFLHEFSGFVVFGVALISLFIAGSSLEWLSRKLPQPSS